ncbi:MAG: hypothetical protein N3D20_00930 [Candidatus Pacearchaeota archaeon]|nr:hypothetical protein [Candidatus Pacearchaeota archaeon]
MSSDYYFRLMGIKKSRKEALKIVSEVCKKFGLSYNPIGGFYDGLDCRSGPFEEAEKVVLSGGSGYLRFDNPPEPKEKYIEIRVSFYNVSPIDHFTLVELNEGELNIVISVDGVFAYPIVFGDNIANRNLIVGLVKELISILKPSDVKEHWDAEEICTENLLGQKNEK